MVWRQLYRIAQLAPVLAILSGCSMVEGWFDDDGVSSSMRGATPQMVQPITDRYFAATLIDAGPNAIVAYRGPDGGESVVQLTLGPLYDSARGAVCRLARPSAESPVILAFCEAKKGWYQVRPVVMNSHGMRSSELER